MPGAVTDGPFGSNLTSAHYTDEGPLVVRLQNIGVGVYRPAPAHISMSHFEKLRKHEVLPGDLLVASLGDSLPRACIAPPDLGPAIVKADCIRVRLRPDVDPRWVNYALQRPQVQRWATDRLHGVGRLRLGLKLIRAIPVLTPPVDEQRRIVEILEDHLSRLDAANDYLDVASMRLDSLRISALHEMTSDLTVKGAPLLRIAEVGTTALGKMLDAKRAAGTPTPYLRNINVRWGHFNLGDVSTVRLSDQERSRLALTDGDVLVCEGGEPGRCAVWRDDGHLMAYQKALHRIRVRPDRITPEFLALSIESFVRSGGAARLFTGTTIKHLPQEKLREISIPVPSLHVQTEVLTRLEGLEASRVQVLEQGHRLALRSAALRRALLAAAFSGRLTGRSSDLDVAEEMALA
jgi:type I restriction enzyme S subunit